MVLKLICKTFLKCSHADLCGYVKESLCFHVRCYGSLCNKIFQKSLKADTCLGTSWVLGGLVSAWLSADCLGIQSRGLEWPDLHPAFWVLKLLWVLLGHHQYWIVFVKCFSFNKHRQNKLHLNKDKKRFSEIKVGSAMPFLSRSLQSFAKVWHLVPSSSRTKPRKEREFVWV